MRVRELRVLCSVFVLMCTLMPAGFGQDSASSTTTTTMSSAVPGLINYSGVLKDATGKTLTGITGVTFLLYSAEQGGTPLWLETQNVTPDKTGHYTVTLGATTAQGLPSDLFSTGEAHWLAVQIGAEAEQPRTLLVAVPYAIKAVDAQTLGGLPASAFVLANANTSTSSGSGTTTKASAAAKNSAPPANPAVTGKGTVDYISMWDTTSDIVDSVIFQKSSAIGIATTAPAATLDVNGKSDVRDTLTLFPKSTDNTLAVSGTTFAVSSAGKVTFISGQTFPGAGTITGITTASGSGLSGGGTTGTLSLKIPSAGVTNAMLADSKLTIGVTAPLTGGGAVSLGGTSTAIALKPCSANQVYVSNGTTWSCAAAGTGTITGITTASGSGLAGGGTSGTLNLSIPSSGVTNTMLQHSSLTVTPGSGLTGGGAISLGGAATLNIDTTKIPLLSGNNAFSGAQSINSPSNEVALTVYSAGSLGDPQEEILQNNTSDFARLRFTNSGTSDYWDIAGLSGGTSEMNFWNGTAGVNILQLYPNFVEANGNLYVDNGAGDGADIYSTSIGWGSFAEADADGGFNTGAAGWETGASQQDLGVWGWAGSSIGIGVYGEGTTSSSTGMPNGDYPTGVWGSSGATYGFGIAGSADEGWAIVGYNNSNDLSTLYLENLGTGGTGSVFAAVGKNGQCNSDVNGNLNCTGNVAVVAPVNGGASQVALSAIHSAENWFEDAGSGQLASGEAVVNIESTFGETVNTGVEYHVFLTPNGDCKGLYVAQKSATSFVVKELGGGTSNIAFDYRIMAKRSGFETVRLTDRTKAMATKQPNRRPAGAKAINPDDVRKARLRKSAEFRKASAVRATARRK